MIIAPLAPCWLRVSFIALTYLSLSHLLTTYQFTPSQQLHSFSLGLSIQSEDPTHPKIPTVSDPKTGRPDQVTGRRRVICSKKPTPAGRSRFSSPEPEKTRSDRCTKIFIKKFPESGGNFQNPAEISRIRRYVLDSGYIFQIPASNFQIPASNF